MAAPERGAEDAMDDRLRKAAQGGLTLLGCGRMGGAMLEGWLTAGLPAEAVTVIEPAAGEAVAGFVARGVRLAETPPTSSAVVVLAVKPQVMAAALPAVAPLSAWRAFSSSKPALGM